MKTALYRSGIRSATSDASSAIIPRGYLHCDRCCSCFRLLSMFCSMNRRHTNSTQPPAPPEEMPSMLDQTQGHLRKVTDFVTAAQGKTRVLSETVSETLLPIEDLASKIRYPADLAPEMTQFYYSKRKLNKSLPHGIYIYGVSCCRVAVLAECRKFDLMPRLGKFLWQSASMQTEKPLIFVDPEGPFPDQKASRKVLTLAMSAIAEQMPPRMDLYNQCKKQHLTLHHSVYVDGLALYPSRPFKAGEAVVTCCTDPGDWMTLQACILIGVWNIRYTHDYTFSASIALIFGYGSCSQASRACLCRTCPQQRASPLLWSFTKRRPL